MFFFDPFSFFLQEEQQQQQQEKFARQGWREKMLERVWNLYGSTPKLPSYDRKKNSDVLDWNTHVFIINKRPVFIRSGEFHYWRVPDRERWRRILSEYKAAGLNAIRIYFHWGWHSSCEGEYNFTGNRDINYLMQLCEEIGLYVIAAPGPYICAETSAGGFPTWLLQKTHIRIRHAYVRLYRKYDAEFIRYSCEWLGHIFGELSPHQITRVMPPSSPLHPCMHGRGCVIAVQLENELFLAGIFAHEYELGPLVDHARRCAIDVPLFHNDAKDFGSFVPGTGSHGLDLYSFDRYVEIPPVSMAGISGSWSCKRFIQQVKGTEQRVRKFGHGAASAPIFVAEMQGGWFRQWQSSHMNDRMYSYFGSSFTALLLEAFVSEGVTATNIYMFYGGTNWGAIGDPDVITSYDYSACIRENGYVSQRYRRLRQTNLFLQSWERELGESEAIPSHSDSFSSDFIFGSRRSKRDGSLFVILANLSDSSAEPHKAFRLRVPGTSVTLPFTLPHKHSFIAVGNVALSPRVKLVMSTLPLLVRGLVGDTQVLVAAQNGGGLLLEAKWGESDVQLFSSQDVEYLDNGRCDLSFHQPGVVRLVSSDSTILIFVLSPEDAATLTADFEPPAGVAADSLPRISVAWGTYNLRFEVKNLVVDMMGSARTVTLLRHGKPPAGFKPAPLSSLIPPPSSSPLPWTQSAPPGLFRQTFGAEIQVPSAEEENAAGRFRLSKTRVATVQNSWDSVDWIPLAGGNSPQRSSGLSWGFTSGHIAYRCKFNVADPSTNIQLRLNIRHKMVMWLNGRCIGTQLTYNNTWKLVEHLFVAGVFQGILPLMGGNSCGADSEWLGGRDFDLRQSGLVTRGANTLIVLVDSFGQCRQAIFNNDVRNPRGILSARVEGDVDNISWEIAGTDVTKTNDVFNVSGLPLEKYFVQNAENAPATLPTLETRDFPSTLDSTDGLVWVQSEFAAPLLRSDAKTTMYEPLLVEVEGRFSAWIWINGLAIGRYHGDLGPQSKFCIPDGILRRGKGEKNLLVVGMYSSETTAVQLRIARCRIAPESGNMDGLDGVALVPLVVDSLRLPLLA